MSKFVVGDKVLLEAEIVEISNKSEFNTCLVFKDSTKEWFKEKYLIPVSKFYLDGLNDSWQLARKLVLSVSDGGISIKDFEIIFGAGLDYKDILKIMTPQQALAKIEAYKKSQQIQVGDVVTTVNGTCKYIVTNIQEPNTLHVINSQSGYVQQMRKDVVKKTGRTVDIEHLLEQIKGNE